jgi:hypothetical protein
MASLSWHELCCWIAAESSSNPLRGFPHDRAGIPCDQTAECENGACQRMNKERANGIREPQNLASRPQKKLVGSFFWGMPLNESPEHGR